MDTERRASLPRGPRDRAARRRPRLSVAVRGARPGAAGRQAGREVRRSDGGARLRADRPRRWSRPTGGCAGPGAATPPAARRAHARRARLRGGAMTAAPEAMTGGRVASAAVFVARPAALPPADTRLVVVEASAGTGKTYFLEHRVVDLVLAGAELGEILLVTFTDKAVAELRLRIRDVLDRLSRANASTAEIGEPAWVIDEAARRRLRAAVTAFDHAPIYTIHGF